MLDTVGEEFLPRPHTSPVSQPTVSKYQRHLQRIYQNQSIIFRSFHAVSQTRLWTLTWGHQIWHTYERKAIYSGVDFEPKRSKVKVARLKSVHMPVCAYITTLHQYLLDGMTLCCRPRKHYYEWVCIQWLNLKTQHLTLDLGHCRWRLLLCAMPFSNSGQIDSK